jgi:serine/threonine protein kinase
MIEFTKVHIIKELGYGLYGTTYLAKYNNKLYALKIQHILEKDSNKDYNNEIWREMSLYNYIKKINKEEQLFFTKLYNYSICKCDHKQKRDGLTKSHPNYKKIMELDKSPWCIKYLTEYKGKSTLYLFLQKKKISSKLAYSFALQIAKIMLILYKGGYSHNDMHFGNIMVTKTSKKYFILNDKKIPYCGYQLSSIDYGEVLHKKFGVKYNNYNKLFLEDRRRWLYYEYNGSVFGLFNNEGLLVKDCKDQKKKIPWEGKINTEDMLFKKIIISYTELFNEIKERYLSKEINTKLLDKIVVLCKTNKLNKPIYSYVANKKGEHAFWWFYNRLIVEFRIKYPEKYVKYIKWCSIRPFAISVDELKELLPIHDIDKLIEKLIMFLN